MSLDLPTFDDVERAAATLRGVAHRTPIFRSRGLDDRCGCRVSLKCENLQRTGSFKFRGAFNAVRRHAERSPGRGLLTFSSGNHAQAMALAGRLHHLPVTVVMPDDAPTAKRRATEAYGAEIVLYDKRETTREEIGARLASQRELELIPPYDHFDVIAGQGTVARELHRDGEDFDVLLVCLGGGGLLAGSILSTTALAPSCRVFGVEPALADDGARSLETGVLQSVRNPETVADGARTPSLGVRNFAILRERVAGIVTVSDEAILEAMHFLWQRVKLVVEPTGALALAALFEHRIPVDPELRVAVTLSGGNVDLARAAEMLAPFEAVDAEPGRA